MVIYNLHVKGVATLEPKTYTPLFIDSDAPLTFAITSQSLQPVAWRSAEIIKRAGIVDHLQFPFSDSGKCSESTGSFSLEQRLGVLAAEGLDHDEGYNV